MCVIPPATLFRRIARAMEELETYGIPKKKKRARTSMATPYELFAFRMKGLTPLDKLVLIRIASFDSASHKRMFMSQSALADEINVSRQSVNKSISDLLTHNLIIRFRVTGGISYAISDDFKHRFDLNDTDLEVSKKATPTVKNFDTFCQKKRHIDTCRRQLEEETSFLGVELR